MRCYSICYLEFFSLIFIYANFVSALCFLCGDCWNLDIDEEDEKEFDNL